VTELSGPDGAGIGSLLMVDPALPQDEFGHPYQPLFWFDDDGRGLGLVVDGDGHVMGWENNAEGDPFCDGDPDRARCQRMPAAVEAAARRWWHEQAT